MKKVFLVIDHLGFGGAQLQIKNAYIELLNRGYKVNIVNLSSNTPSKEFKYLSEAIINYPKYFKNFYFFKIIFLFTNYLKYRPHFVLSYGYTTSIYITLSYFLLPVKTIFMDRALFKSSYSFFFKIYKKFLPFAFKIVTNSQEQYLFYKINYPNYLNKLIYQPNFYFKLPSCINHKYQKEKIHHLVALGRVDRDKNYEYLIDSLRYLPNTDLIQLDIIGSISDKTYYLELKKLKNSLQNQRNNISINFLGHKYEPFKFIYENSIFIICSKSEGFPNVLIEAMYNNLSIISPNLLQLNLILKNYGKSFVFDNTKESLINAIHKSINKIESIENINTKSSKNFSVLEKYSAKKFLREIFPFVDYLK